jgi:hypothetical protein
MLIMHAGADLTENTNECLSTGKHPCVFPFYYKGEKYEACTSLDEFQGKLWCATSTEFEASKWQYCQCVCKHCDSVAARVHIETSRGQTLVVNLTQTPGRLFTPEQVSHFAGGRVGGPVDVFTGQFQTRTRNSVYDQAGPSEVLVTPGNFLTFSYQDEAPYGNDTLVLEILNTGVGILSANPWPAVPGSPLFVTLTDPDAYDFTSSTNSDVMTQTITIDGPSMDTNLVRNGISGEVKVVDDGTGGGRFTGVVMPMLPEQALNMRQTTVSDSLEDNVVTVNYDDWLSLEYQDLLPLQTVRYPVKVATPGTLETSVLQAGGEMTITVHDSDLDWSHHEIDSFETAVSGPSSERPINVNMIETEPHSGKFTGLLSTNPLSLSDPFITNSSYLAGVAQGQSVVVLYEDLQPRQTLYESRTVTSSTSGEVHTDAVNGNINKGDIIGITVVDLDLNLSPFHVDECQVFVSQYKTDSNSGTRGQPAGTIMLKEVALDSAGIFTGVLSTRFGLLNREGDNGALDVSDGDHLVLRYRDAAPARTMDTTVKVSTPGSVHMFPALLDAGKEITLQVQDYDLNIDPLAPDLSSASVRSANGDVEEVTLTETGLDTSVFTGTVPSSTNVSAPAGTLAGVVPDSVITATYVDKLVDTPTRTQSITATARVATNGSLVLLPVLVLQDFPVTMTVTDRDRNLDAIKVENILCKLVSICSSETQSWDGSPLCSMDAANERVLDTQIVTLTENSEDSGIFTAIMATHSENRTNSSRGHIEPSVRAPSGALIRLEYFDAAPVPSRVRATQRRVARAGLLYTDSYFLNEYAPLIITLEDADLDSSDVRDTNCAPGGMEGEDLGELLRNCPSPVKLIGQPNNGTHEVVGYQVDGINVLLYETSAHSGVFTGKVETSSLVSEFVQSGIVQAATQGSFITLTYGDQVPAAVRSKQVKIASVATITTEPSILPAGNDISITVVDQDLNMNQALVETSMVTVSQGTHDTRQLGLTETGPDSGQFTGLLQTRTDSNTDGSASLFAPAGSFLTVTIIDAHPVPARERSVIVPISTRGVIHMQCPVSGAASTWTACSQYDITVTDADLNSLSDTIEIHTGRLSLYNQRGEESEQLLLTERGVDKDAFTASVAVLVSSKEDCGGAGSGLQGDGL